MRKILAFTVLSLLMVTSSGHKVPELEPNKRDIYNSLYEAKEALDSLKTVLDERN